MWPNLRYTRWMTKNPNAFPDTSYIDDLVGPDSPAVDLLRAGVVIETYAQGSRWFRNKLHQEADVQGMCDRLPSDRRSEIAADVGRITHMFERDALAEKLARHGSLFTEPVPPNIRRRQLNILQGSWARVASRAVDISMQPVQPIREYGVGMSGPDSFSMRKFFIAANVGAFWLRLDMRAAARANEEGHFTNSAFRENVLVERANGVTAFDRLLHELRFCSLVGGLDAGLSALRTEWELNRGERPGTGTFYPPGYDRDCIDRISIGVFGDMLHRVVSQGMLGIAEARINHELGNYGNFK